MRDTLELAVRGLRRSIVQQQNRAISSQKILFECEDLPAEPKRIVRQHAHFRKRIENDTDRIYPFDLVQDHPRRFVELNFRRMKDRVTRIVRQALARVREVLYIDAVKRPAMRSGDRQQFLLAFRQGDVKTLLAGADTFHQELET